MAVNADLRAFLSALGHVEAAGVTEVCVFQGGKKPTHVGYYDNPEAAVKAITTHDGRGNIFVTLNPALRDLLARCNNRLVEGTYKNPAERTKDHEMRRDSWFPLDVDPERPSNISSTDEEKRLTLEVAKAVRDWLLSVGVPASAMMTCDSGNGAYVLVRTPDCKVTDEHIERKKAFLNFIADKFDTERVKIDRTVYNPARLIGALGAMKVKGESIPERPHRRSAVRTIAGEPFDPSKEQRCEPFDLYALAAKLLPPPEAKKKPEAKNAGQTTNSAGKVWLDARLIADKLNNSKSSGRGFTYYDCPNCGSSQKFWIDEATGKSGCFEPDSVCDWRRLRDKLREIAGVEVEEQGSAAPKASVDDVLSRIVTAQTILNTEYPEPKWAVKGLIPEGTTFIAGPPKLGKSIFSLCIAVAVSEGGKALSHFDVEQGSVLYLALEDGPRRIQERLRKLTNGRISDRLEVVTEWPRTNQGGLEAIEAWIESRKDARLLIVDTLKMLRPQAGAPSRKTRCGSIVRKKAGRWTRLFLSIGE
jgi:AAA domain